MPDEFEADTPTERALRFLSDEALRNMTTAAEHRARGEVMASPRRAELPDPLDPPPPPP